MPEAVVFALHRSVLCVPFRERGRGGRPATVEEVICQQGETSRHCTAGQGPAHNVMKKRIGMGVGTHPHAKGAVRALHTPESVAALLIRLPLLDPVVKGPAT